MLEDITNSHIPSDRILQVQKSPNDWGLMQRAESEDRIKIEEEARAKRLAEEGITSCACTYEGYLTNIC